MINTEKYLLLKKMMMKNHLPQINHSILNCFIIILLNRFIIILLYCFIIIHLMMVLALIHPFVS